MKPGDVVLVRFPFAELATAKKRPALVLAVTVRSPRNQIVTLAMITSQVEALGLLGDVALTEWADAGLLHPSLVRLAKTATVDAELIDKVIGALSNSDSDRIGRGSAPDAAPGGPLRGPSGSAAGSGRDPLPCVDSSAARAAFQRVFSAWVD